MNLNEGFADTALILCAHGVNGTPGAAADHAARLHARGLYAGVAAACLNGTPNLTDVIDAQRAARLVVVPFLMAAGRTYGTVLPERIAATRRRADVVLTEPVGTHPDIARLIAGKAAAAAGEHGWPLERVQLVIAAHGTARDPQSGVAARDHAGRIAATRRFAAVEAGYLDEPPSLEGLLAGRAALHAVGVGLFADAGPHGAGDAAMPFDIDPEAAYAGPIGPDPALAEIALLRALSALPAV